MPQAVHGESAAANVRPKARRFERNLRARVEYAAIHVLGGCARAGSVTVICEPATGSRRDVQPAKEGFGQENLLERIGASGRVVIRAKRADGSEERIGFGEAAAVIAGGAFALIIQGRIENLLAEPGQPQIRKTLDGLKEIIEQRLGVEIEAEVLPHLFGFDIGRRLRILAVFALKEIVQDAEIILIAHNGANAQICKRLGQVGEVKALTIVAEVVGQSAKARARIIVVSVVITE